MKKTLLVTCAAIAVMSMAVPAAAETFTASNGVLSIDLPGENWKEVVDPSKWIALSDGANVITIDHFSNGEKLPDINVADDHYVDVYEAVFSTQNEVFIITGSVVDAEKIPDIANAIMSTKVLKYDTKLAVKKDDKVSISEFSVAPLDKTMYVTTDGLNVRMGCTTDETVIGTLSYGEQVKVTGNVQRNGADLGWFQIAYEGTTGYVSSAFLSESAPAQKTTAQNAAPAADTNSGKTETEKNNTANTFTGNAKTIYTPDGGAITVYEAKDGNWYDNAGNGYVWTTTYEFVSANGAGTYSVNRPVDTTEAYQVGAPFTVYWGNGNGETLVLYSDGYYYSSGWVRYYDGGDNSFYGADGTVLYGSMGGPAAPVSEEELSNEDTESYTLVRREDGATVTVSAGGGAYYDSEGTEYSWIGDGGMMDFYGHTYDVY